MDDPKKTVLPSERAFGFLFSSVFGGIGVYGLLTGWSRGASLILLGCSLGIGLIAVTAPHILCPFNKLWFRLGEILAMIMNPIVLGVMFFGLVTPIALVGKLMGRDELRLKRRNRTTYWLDRVPPGPRADSFFRQF